MILRDNSTKDNSINENLTNEEREFNREPLQDFHRTCL